VFEVLKLAGLHNVWTIVETRDEGLKQLGRKGGGGDGTATLLMALGAIGVAAGIFGIAMYFYPEFIPLSLVTKKTGWVIALIGAALGLFAGTICFSKGTGARQKAGIFFAVAGIVILILGILNPPPGQPGSPKKSDDGGESATGGGPAKNEAGSDDAKPENKKKGRQHDDDESTAEGAKSTDPPPKEGESAPVDAAEGAGEPPKEGGAADKPALGKLKGLFKGKKDR